MAHCVLSDVNYTIFQTTKSKHNKTFFMKKLATHLLLLAGLSGALATQLSAITILPTDGVLNVTRWQGDETSQAQINAVIAGIIGNSTEVYKQNVGEANDTGSLAGSYATSFSNTPNDPSDALIDYGSGPFILPTAYLLVKDGNQSPAWYLFDLTALGLNKNAGEDIIVDNFWPQNGAISHVALYNGPADIPGVPDGGSTVAFLGLALTALAFVRRKLA
jgi:hypothetical protein